MSKLHTYTDKFAIGLSVMCAFHCLGLPLLLIVFPSMTALGLANEAFHLWMILGVIPTSLYALTLGCKKHKHSHLLLIGLAGLTFLLAAIVIPEALLGEWGERGLTLMGAAILALGHFKNYRLCQSHNRCGCPHH